MKKKPNLIPVPGIILLFFSSLSLSFFVTIFIFHVKEIYTMFKPYIMFSSAVASLALVAVAFASFYDWGNKITAYVDNLKRNNKKLLKERKEGKDEGKPNNVN